MRICFSLLFAALSVQVSALQGAFTNKQPLLGFVTADWQRVCSSTLSLSSHMSFAMSSCSPADRSPLALMVEALSS